MKNLLSTSRNGLRQQSVRRKPTTSGSPTFLSREIPGKFVENTDFRPPPPGVWFGGDVTKQKQNIFLTRTSVNAAVSDLRSRLWETHQYLEPFRRNDHSEEKSSTAVEFELSNKPNPHVINQLSALHKCSKLKRWVRVIYQHFLLNFL